MNHTINNHIKYYIDDQLYGHRTNSIETFRVNIGSIDKEYYKTSNYVLELKRVANLVYHDFGQDFALFLSGGTDSEIVARNFLSIGIVPNCFTIKFNNDLNIDDVKESELLCRTLGLPLNIIDFDILNFYFSGEALEFSKKIQCTQIAYLTVYYNILKLQLPSVMGGELLLKRHVNSQKSYWYYCLRENEDCSAIRFSNMFNIPLVNEWFSYTPEVMLYYLENSDIQKLVTTKDNKKLSSASSKNSILKKLLPDIMVRNKTHGFEKLLAFNHEVYRNLSYHNIMRTEESLDGIEYNTCIQMLKGEYENH